jgi:ABC-type transport system substrate-binding protein
MPLGNFGNYADPAALLADIVLPGGIANYTNFNDPKITKALEQARSTPTQTSGRRWWPRPRS